MHLAILMTNTDESVFAQAHPKDGEKFTRFIQMARPGWTTEVFSVKDGVFPGPQARFDGVMITGSPASVRSGAPWIGRLLALIRDLHARQVPMFGACFGHQAIALALGGTVGTNPDGWVHGIVPVDVTRPAVVPALPARVHLCASHAEQVTALPTDALPYASSPGCPLAGFALGTHILAIQHHPEMTAPFLAALTDEMAQTLGPALAEAARASVDRAPDQLAYAETTALFFEAARGR